MGLIILRTKDRRRTYCWYWLWGVWLMNNPVQDSYFVIRMPQTVVLFVIRNLLSISHNTVSLSF